MIILTHDISKDSRVLIVEHVLKKLKDMSLQKRYKLPSSKEKTMEAINKLNSVIKQIKFSYISPSDLANDRMVKELELMSNQFWDAIMKYSDTNEKNKLIFTELKFIFNILKGFKERLKLGNESTIENSIDIIAVKILSISVLNKKENLKVCRVGNGFETINVITNLTSIKKDMVLPAAILPPREFGSEISEAMFCSEKDIPEMHEKVGERVTLPESDLKEINNHIIALLKNN